jgi:hypothetical protein
MTVRLCDYAIEGPAGRLALFCSGGWVRLSCAIQNLISKRALFCPKSQVVKSIQNPKPVRRSFSEGGSNIQKNLAKSKSVSRPLPFRRRSASYGGQVSRSRSQRYHPVQPQRCLEEFLNTTRKNLFPLFLDLNQQRHEPSVWRNLSGRAGWHLSTLE